MDAGLGKGFFCMTTELSQTLQQALRRAAGPDNYQDCPKQRWMYGADASGLRHPPQAVIRATDTAQVGRVLEVCQAHAIPVVPRGAGSGLTGGAVPMAGGLVLDLAGMDRIISVSAQDMVAVVQPGVITADLQAAAEAQGMFYPPDPASVGFCSVGGNVAENAGGLRAVKYGVTRDYVLGLTAVLADGRVFKTGSPTMKGVVGYDLTRLIVGSEGTLAVITEITLRLMSKPEATRTISGLYPTLDGAAAGVRALLASGIVPTAIEFMDSACVAAVEAYASLGLPDWARAMLLVDLDGAPEVVERQAGEVARLLEEAGGRQVHLARDRAESELLWKARRALGPAVYALGQGKYNEDIVVPLGRLAEMVRRLQGIARERGVTIASFGHAGDGNLHVNVMFDPSDPAQLKGAQQAVSDVFANTLELGGSLSGEHGVGAVKLGFVGAEVDPVALELMRGLKRLFDPAGILNPHKAVPAEEITS